MKKKISLSTAVTLVLLAVALTVSLTMLVALRHFNNQLQALGARQAMYTHIDQVDKTIRAYYPDLDEEALRQGITQGYIYGLNDPYAVYYTPTRYAAEQLRLRGKANNVGITLCLNEKGAITVGRVQEDSAAGKAGVQVGDVVMTVDGVSTEGKSLSELQTLVSSASKVLLSVQRGQETLAYEMSAYEYTVRTVQGTMLDTVGYVRITAFYENTPEQFQAVVSSMLEQGATALIFDLRNNTGGLSDAVQKMLSYVLPLGPYGMVTDVNGYQTKLSSVKNNQIGVSTVTLVNTSTAGEAEFFAGVLQECSLTTVVGQTTAGKAKYQEYFQLESDSSAVKLTAGTYSRLKSGSWQGVGIQPTVTVELPLEQASIYQLLTLEQDAQVQAALKQIVTPVTPTTTTTAPSTTTTTAPSGETTTTTSAEKE